MEGSDGPDKLMGRIKFTAAQQRGQQQKQQHQQPNSIRFLNVTNPNDAPDKDNIKIIRSHAAQDSHTRRQEGRLIDLEIRQYKPKEKARAVDDDDNGPQQGDAADAQSLIPVKRLHRPRSRVRFREFRSTSSDLILPDPEVALAGSRKNPFQSCARNVTRVENFMIDHYITHVIDHGYSACVYGEVRERLLGQVRTTWLPWSLADPGLLSALLMTACRSLITLYPDNQAYKIALLKYKNECIQTARAALTQNDGMPSDHIIALALVLACEEVILFREPDRIGITQQRHTQDGQYERQQGPWPGGFLWFLISRSVYNPKYRIVSGPMVNEVWEYNDGNNHD
ncbi:hypothetical protein PT974_10711 [Cladobotryum mycophilum]|uniref:Uncharacterized protein n=1 Tax=Cladobotryum mycophilum TaxID=491253 RepID=A0ABR0SB83_9HYPO